MKLSRIGRIVGILTTLQSGQCCSADQLAKQAGVSRRTIFRDLNELQAVGVPFSFDAQAGGYRLDPEYFLPSVNLNLQEALSLLMLVYKSRSHLHMPFKNSVLLAGAKIENNLPREIQRYCNTTLQNISIQPASYAPMESLDKIFARLQSALRRKRRVRIEYCSLRQGRKEATTLDPYHLMYNNRSWYIIGKSSRHKEIRTFNLNRIKGIDTLDKCFVAKQPFDIAEYLGKAWSMIPEGRLYNVQLRFSRKVATNVTEVHWHSSQKIVKNGDGSITAHFRVDGLGEIGWWILGYGDEVEVLAPAALRKRIAKKAERMAKLNS